MKSLVVVGLLIVASLLALGCAPIAMGVCRERCTLKGRQVTKEINKLRDSVKIERRECKCRLPTSLLDDQGSAPDWWYSPYGKLCPVFSIDVGIAHRDKNERKLKKCESGGDKCILRQHSNTPFPDCNKVK